MSHFRFKNQRMRETTTLNRIDVVIGK